MQPKRGRPRGLNVNPIAVEDLLRRACLSKQELAVIIGVTPGHLSDMLKRGKGARPEVIRKMATALDVSPETLAPELLSQFVVIRNGDPAPVEVEA